MGNYTGSRIDPDRTCNCIVHWRLAIYDRIRTGYNDEFEFIDIRDDHDAKLSVRTIFIMAFAVCVQTTVWRIKERNLLDSTFCLGYFRKWYRHEKQRRELEEEAMSFAQNMQETGSGNTAF